MFCLKHTFVESRDGKAIFCVKCGKTKLKKCGHHWEEENVVNHYEFHRDKYPYKIITHEKCAICGKRRKYRS